MDEDDGLDDDDDHVDEVNGGVGGLIEDQETNHLNH